MARRPSTAEPDDRKERFVRQVHEHQGIVHRVSRLYAVDAADRADLVQEILLQLWRSFPSFRGASRFTTWAYRVALNTAITRRRREGARRESAALPEEVAAPPEGEGREGQDEVEALEEAIRELPELDRALILLRLEERGYEEIAEITGLTRANVSVRLVRIKERLRRRLAGGLHGERTIR